jgi:hypothetical protein
VAASRLYLMHEDDLAFAQQRLASDGYWPGDQMTQDASIRMDDLHMATQWPVQAEVDGWLHLIEMPGFFVAKAYLR